LDQFHQYHTLEYTGEYIDELESEFDGRILRGPEEDQSFLSEGQIQTSLGVECNQKSALAEDSLWRSVHVGEA
jgi:hypothetical protein